MAINTAKSGGTAERPNESEEKSPGPVFANKAYTNAGWVEVAVFAKEITNDKKTFTVFNTAIKRAWKSDKGYESSNSLRHDDLLPMSQLLEEAWRWINNELAKK